MADSSGSDNECVEISSGPFAGFEACGFKWTVLPGFPPGVVVKSHLFGGFKVYMSEEYLAGYIRKPVAHTKFTQIPEVLEVILLWKGFFFFEQ